MISPTAATIQPKPVLSRWRGSGGGSPVGRRRRRLRLLPGGVTSRAVPTAWLGLLSMSGSIAGLSMPAQCSQPAYSGSRAFMSSNSSTMRSMNQALAIWAMTSPETTERRSRSTSP